VSFETVKPPHVKHQSKQPARHCLRNTTSADSTSTRVQNHLKPLMHCLTNPLSLPAAPIYKTRGTDNPNANQIPICLPTHSRSDIERRVNHFDQLFCFWICAGGTK